MAEQSNECRSDHHHELRWLQQEVLRQRNELDEVESVLVEQRQALEHLRVQLAVMMGSWRGDVRRDLGGLIRTIDATNDTRVQWERLRDQVQTTSAEVATHALGAGVELTPFETNVWMLTGLKLSESEIASVLDQPVRAIIECREQINLRLQRGAVDSGGAASAAELDSAVTHSPGRQATARGGR
ncbi:MAG TPA: hypothetical protein VNA88_19620 [Candidatus Kapabacteria bacterium]|jgi:hypothetical protein|nr:hypothetical protein [Candidatus Kapabacteria bacterium]